MASVTKSAGAETLAEILSQPRCWTACWRMLREQETLASVHRQFPSPAGWLFIGCGSSYYIAQAAAAVWSAVTRQRAKAVPASDLLLFPDQVLADASGYQPVLISRSGHTSEVLRAGEFLESRRNQRSLAITCAANTPLEQIASLTIPLLPADERSTVMTRSFTSMLMTLEALAAVYTGRSDLCASLENLSAPVEALLPDLSLRIGSFVKARNFRDYVFLGQGPFYAIAADAALKVTEMSCSYTQSYHTLEFRHGPKSIADPETLVAFFVSRSGYEAESSVLTEIKALGAITMVVTDAAYETVRRAADFLVELRSELGEFAWLASAVIPGQLLGVHTGIQKGLDPDNPRNLTRVVTLSEEGA
ncbi:MAG: SIS domain-containing protein [Candidatus Acidiferrales bacterium]